MPPRSQLYSYDSVPSDSRLKKPATILSSCSRTVASLLDAFDNPGGKTRGTGSPKDTEQDLLRAMLLFAGAGLDSTIKRVMDDTVRDAIDSIDATRQEFERFIATKLTKRTSGTDTIDATFLSATLASKDPRHELIKQFIRRWRSGSLQSADELYRALALFGIDPKKLGFTKAELKQVFDVRNKIAHEMDAEFTATRSRNQRARDDMVRFSSILIETTAVFIDLVESLLPKKKGK